MINQPGDPGVAMVRVNRDGTVDVFVDPNLGKVQVSFALSAAADAIIAVSEQVSGPSANGKLA